MEHNMGIFWSASIGPHQFEEDDDLMDNHRE